jgi:RNA 3'-terminal phosphate cyclase (ATP)
VTGADPVVVDGSAGEGGGQVLRTSLALSLCTGRAVRIANVRARRKRPGLLHQHLTAVQIAAEVGAAEVQGASLGSRAVEFRPQAIGAGRYQRAIGTAGSTTLVAQTVLPALCCADAPSELVLDGGTHNPLAPPFDFLARTFVPALRAFGVVAEVELVRHGFQPNGGGCMRMTVRPGRPRPFDWHERGAVHGLRARALVADLPASIGEREIAVVRQKLGVPADRAEVATATNGPGNVLTIDVECEHATEVFTAFGRLGHPAERVAAEAVRDAKAYLRHTAPVGEHLADQLVLFVALAGGGSFRTSQPSTHLTTNARVIEAFLPVRFAIDACGDGTWLVAVRT